VTDALALEKFTGQMRRSRTLSTECASLWGSIPDTSDGFFFHLQRVNALSRRRDREDRIGDVDQDQEPVIKPYWLAFLLSAGNTYVVMSKAILPGTLSGGMTKLTQEMTTKRPEGMK